jgi:hypothetical protein
MYFTSRDEVVRRMKPFYYELDASGALQRHVNPLFNTDLPAVTFYDRMKSWPNISRSSGCRS